MDLVERAISQKKVKDFKKFAQWARKTKQKPRPKNPLAVKAKRKGQGSDAAGDETALIAAIRWMAINVVTEILPSLVARLILLNTAEYKMQ